MKKYISLALVLGMMLTLVGIIPAEAKVYEEYPYIYSDFEDSSSISDLIAGSGDSQWVQGGAGGSAGALYITQHSNGAGAMTDHQFSIADAHFMIDGPFKVSAWIKLDTTKTKLKDDKLTVGFPFWGPAELDGKLNATRWHTSWTITDERLASGEWVYFERIITWDGTMNSNYVLVPDAPDAEFKFGIRLGDPGANVFGNFVAEDSPTQEVAWYVDDFIVEPLLDEYDGGSDEPGTPEEPAAQEEGFLLNADFTNPDISSYGLSAITSAVSGNLTHNTGDGPDGEAGYLSHKSTLDQKQFGDVVTSVLPIKYNKLYKFSFWIKADDEDTAGSRISLCFMRNNRLDRTNDVGVYGGTENYQYMRTANDLTTEWKHYEIYMKRNVKSFDEKPFNIQLRVGNPNRAAELGVQEGQEGVAYSLDDFKIEELSVPSNGDFEWLKGDIPADSSNGNDDSNKYGTFYGWFQSGATVEASADVPAESEGAQSAKITTTAADGGINQGVFLENNTTSEITFWAKGEGDSVGKNIQVKLDRAVASKDAKDVYEVPDTELLGENLVLTDAWTQYTIPYESAFPTPSGADPNAGPRQPFMSFVVDGGASGLTYYLDDVEINAAGSDDPGTEPGPGEDAYPYPFATNLSLDSINIVGGTATFRYEYGTEVEALEGNSVVRILKEFEDGSSVTLAQLSAPTNIYEYVIPETALGAKLRFEIMPFTDDVPPVSGAVYKITTDDVIKAQQTITPALGEFDEESGSITGTLYVENNRPDGSDMNMFLAIVLYDADGGVVRFDSKPISVENGSSDNIELSVVTANDPELQPIVKAKAFIWGGTSVYDTDMVSYAEPIEVLR